jgi:hypothetical protein
MHILDLIMYFVLTSIIWYILEKVSNGEFTEEMGGAFIGLPIMVLYTIIYIILFAWIDYNWIDIYHNRHHWFHILKL